MFKGWVLGVCYHSWESFKEAYNKAVLNDNLYDKSGKKITKVID